MRRVLDYFVRVPFRVFFLSALMQSYLWSIGRERRHSTLVMVNGVDLLLVGFDKLLNFGVFDQIRILFFSLNPTRMFYLS